MSRRPRPRTQGAWRGYPCRPWACPWLTLQLRSAPGCLQSSRRRTSEWLRSCSSFESFENLSSNSRQCLHSGVSWGCLRGCPACHWRPRCCRCPHFLRGAAVADGVLAMRGARPDWVTFGWRGPSLSNAGWSPRRAGRRSPWAQSGARGILGALGAYPCVIGLRWERSYCRAVLSRCSNEDSLKEELQYFRTHLIQNCHQESNPIKLRCIFEFIFSILASRK